MSISTRTNHNSGKTPQRPVPGLTFRAIGIAAVAAATLRGPTDPGHDRRDREAAKSGRARRTELDAYGEPRRDI